MARGPAHVGAVRVGVHGRQKLIDDQPAVAGDPHVGRADLAQLGRVDVDVDDLGLRGEGADLAGDPVVEPGAQADEQVAALHGGHRGVVAVHAGHAQALGVRVGEGAPCHQGGDHRDPGALRQRTQRVGCPRLEDSTPDVEHRATGVADQLRRPTHERRIALGHRVVAGKIEIVDRGGPVPLHGGVGDVLGKVDEHRAGSAGGGHVEGGRHHAGDVIDVLDQPVVLGDAHGDAGDVALLKGVGADRSRGHLARDHDQRRRVHVGVGQRGDDVGGPRPAGHHGHAGLPGHHGVALGHVAAPCS